MKLQTRFHVCGVTCQPGGENCNNYCNNDKTKPMPDSPATYQSLQMDEADMWKDVIQIIAEYIPHEKSVFEVLQSKYTIKQYEQ